MKYDRFLDIHVMYKDHYDFVDPLNNLDDVQIQLDYQKQTHAFPHIHNLTPWGTAGYQSLNKKPTLDLSKIEQGCIAVAVDVEKIHEAESQPGARQLLAWVGDTKRRGKIRINAHGDGMGNLGMFSGYAREANRTFFPTTGDKIADWLKANGLPSPSGLRDAASETKVPAPSGGLVATVFSKSSYSGSLKGLNTLTMALCMATRYKSNFAAVGKPTRNVWGHGKKPTQAALDSVVNRCVAGLRKHKLFNIEVTGSNEIVADAAGQIGRLIILPEGWTLVSSSAKVKQLKTPDGYEVNPAKTFILINKKDFEVYPGTWRRGQDGWLVMQNGKVHSFIPTCGWNLTEGSTEWVVQPPLGWTPIADGKGGSITFELKKTGTISKNQNAYEEVWLRLAHTSEKARDIS